VQSCRDLSEQKYALILHRRWRTWWQNCELELQLNIILGKRWCRKFQRRKSVGPSTADWHDFCRFFIRLVGLLLRYRFPRRGQRATGRAWLREHDSRPPKYKECEPHFKKKERTKCASGVLVRVDRSRRIYYLETTKKIPWITFFTKNRQKTL